MDKSPEENTDKETAELNNTIDQIDLTDIYRTFHQQQKNTHTSQVHTEHSARQITS